MKIFSLLLNTAAPAAPAAQGAAESSNPLDGIIKLFGNNLLLLFLSGHFCLPVLLLSPFVCLAVYGSGAVLSCSYVIPQFR